ncbi:hypothetical protein [Limnofasciculus baicalensis]
MATALYAVLQLIQLLMMRRD